MKRWQYNCLIWPVALFIRSTSPLRGFRLRRPKLRFGFFASAPLALPPTTALLLTCTYLLITHTPLHPQ